MKFIIVLQLLLSTTLFAQISHIYSFGREWVVVNESVFERGAKAFYPIPDLPRISTGADLGLVSRAFDGDYGYLTEQVGNKALRLRFGQKLATQEGPRWFWSMSQVLKGEFHFLAVNQKKALVERLDATDENGDRLFQILTVDLLGGESNLVISLKDPATVRQASAVASGGQFVVFVNDGSIHLVEAETRTSSVIETDFLHKASPKFVDSISDGNGKSRSQPPMFIGSPFFSKEGEIYVPMQLRERNRWSMTAMQALFDDLPIAEKSKAIEAGKWPPKQEYEGSDTVFVLIRYDFDLRKVTAVQPERLGVLVRADKYTGQIMLVQTEWPVDLTEMGGQILLLKDALKESGVDAKTIK